MFNVTVNNPQLMKCYDNVNHRYGIGAIEVAVAEKMISGQWGVISYLPVTPVNGQKYLR